MGRRVRPLFAIAGVLTLAACGDRPVLSAWTQESGGFLSSRGFGDATLNNTQIQNGEKSVLIDLNKRFAQEVTSTVNFAFNSARLDATAQAALRQQADWIRQFPEVRFRVYGHTDLVGTETYNKRLGLRRANAVVNYLVRSGISRSRLEAVVSYGENQPLIVTQNRERKNRRTVTEVNGFVSGNPTLLNGKYAALVFREYVASATEIPPATTSQLAAP